MTFVTFALLAVMSDTMELASLSVVTASSAIAPVVTALPTISDVFTQFAASLFESIALSAILVLVTAPLAILA